jgi:tRNA (cytidine/uridine-2'-O-)-methyltransferase
MTITPMFHIVLVEPEIPPNTGNVIRLAANTGCTLHLIEPLGFSLEDRQMRRAGLDYHEYTSVQVHAGWTAFLRDAQPDPARMFAMTTHGENMVHSTGFFPGDWLVFGAETRGLPPELRESFPPAQRLRLPMVAGQRSLNLSNAVAVTVFEAWRQNSFAMPDGAVMVEPEGTIISGFAQLG